MSNGREGGRERARAGGGGVRERERERDVTADGGRWKLVISPLSPLVAL